MGFKTNEAGTFTISLFQFDGLFSGNQDIFIKDNLNGNVHNLKLSNYNFVSNEGNFNERFEIVYQTNLKVNNVQINSSEIIVYKENQQLNINAGKMTMQKIELIDSLGRLIETYSINDTVAKINTQNIASQLLFIRITTTDNKITTKKILL